VGFPIYEFAEFDTPYQEESRHELKMSIGEKEEIKISTY